MPPVSPSPTMVPQIILPELPEHKSFEDRLRSLFMFDCYRVSRILETAQYAMLYACLCLPVGIGIDAMCSKLYPEPENKTTYTGRQLWVAIAVAILQVVISAVSIIYIRKLADLVPFIFNVCPSQYMAHYHVGEIFGETAIALVFVGVQVTLVKKLEIIHRSFVGGSE